MEQRSLSRHARHVVPHASNIVGHVSLVEHAARASTVQGLINIHATAHGSQAATNIRYSQTPHESSTFTGSTMPMMTVSKPVL